MTLSNPFTSNWGMACTYFRTTLLRRHNIKKFYTPMVIISPSMLYDVYYTVVTNKISIILLNMKHNTLSSFRILIFESKCLFKFFVSLN